MPRHSGLDTGRSAHRLESRHSGAKPDLEAAFLCSFGHSPPAAGAPGTCQDLPERAFSFFVSANHSIAG